MGLIDMTNQKFGKWTVIERDTSRNSSSGSAYWFCKCDCGNPDLISVLGSQLRNGRSQSCGKCQQYEIIGKTFGKLTILAIDNDFKKQNNIKNNHTYYKCQCSCENKTIITLQGSSVINGHTTSCGCYRKEKASESAKDITDQIFGRLKALYPTQKRQGANVIWHCICLNDGNECDVRASDLINGHTQSCGCIKSIGETNIQQLLQTNNIIFEKEKTFEELNQYGRYRYDFYLPEYNRLIEFDGIQHFEKNNFFNTRNLSQTQKIDEIKNEYALSHNIDLIRIPYYERDKITLDMILGNKYLISRKGEN